MALNQKKKKKKRWKQLHYNIVLSLSSLESWYIYLGLVLYSTVLLHLQSSAWRQPTSKGLVCFTRSGFHVTDSYSFGNTLQREMDGSNAYYNSSVLMRSGFHVTDSYLGNTSQSEMDDYQQETL
jgi:hypothetical protein